MSGEQFFAEVAQDILLYVSRDLSDEVNPPFLCVRLLVLVVQVETNVKLMV